MLGARSWHLDAVCGAGPDPPAPVGRRLEHRSAPIPTFVSFAIIATIATIATIGTCFDHVCKFILSSFPRRCSKRIGNYSDSFRIVPVSRAMWFRRNGSRVFAVSRAAGRADSPSTGRGIQRGRYSSRSRRRSPHRGRAPRRFSLRRSRCDRVAAKRVDRLTFRFACCMPRVVGTS